MFSGHALQNRDHSSLKNAITGPLSGEYEAKYGSIKSRGKGLSAWSSNSDIPICDQQG